VRSNIEERAADLAVYILDTFKKDPSQATVRAAAGKFGISKSTVHKDLTERLKDYNRALYIQVKKVLEINKAERHQRGGEATKRKYKGDNTEAAKQKGR